MAKALGITLAILFLLSLLIALGVFTHGLYARWQMQRYKRLTPPARSPKKPREISRPPQ